MPLLKIFCLKFKAILYRKPSNSSSVARKFLNINKAHFIKQASKTILNDPTFHKIANFLTRRKLFLQWGLQILDRARTVLNRNEPDHTLVFIVYRFDRFASTVPFSA